ncbi:MAG: PrpF protein [Sphingomonadales bacterium]|nr:PrpF protein [Sphingomonadales bacterium]
MKLHRIRSVFMRGGTSKALVFRAADLPADRAEWDAIFLAAMGVPDANGRNLDGMAGGLSSLNKVCVVGPATHPDADVDYTFVQLGVDQPIVDYGGNCGNMSSAIGPFAVEEGLVPCPSDGEAVVRIHNTNTGKLIVARFAVQDGALAADGDMALDGVAGTAAAVKLEFVKPGGAKTGKLLPTGNAVDTLDIPGLGPVEASLIDAANPCVFVAAAALGLTGTEMPADLDKDAAFLERMEAIRRAGSVAMGLTPDLDAAGRLASIPKVAMLCPPCATTTLSGRELAAGDTDLIVRMISVGQPHRAVPITGSICLAVAARVPGTIAHRLCTSTSGPIRIGHASGTTVVDADVQNGEALNGAVYRTARRLFEGAVVYRA